MGRELVYGRHAVAAVLERDPAGIREAWLQRQRRGGVYDRVRGLALEHGLALREVARGTLDRMTGGATHQGLVIHYRAAFERPAQLADVLLHLVPSSLLLVLDAVQDPHNMGACLRSADAAGVAAVIVPRNRSCPVTPTVRKVASGAVESLTLVAVANLARALGELDAAGVHIVGAVAEAPLSLYEAAAPGPLAVVVGSEDKGLRQLTRKHCHQLVRIPMAGRVASLNVSVAAGICLFEYRRKMPLPEGAAV